MITIAHKDHLRLELHAIRIKINKLEAWCYINAYTPFVSKKRAEIKELLNQTYEEQKRILSQLKIK